MLESRLQKIIEELIQRYPVLDSVKEEIIEAYYILEECFTHDGKLLIAGNGGSAADAEHIAGELMKRFRKPRPVMDELARKMESLDPETASALEKFVASGGRIVCIEKIPYQSVGFRDYEKKSAEVKQTIERIRKNYPERFVRIDAPSGDNQTAWYQRVQQDLHLTPYVKVDRPTKWMFYNYYKSGKRDIFFITNDQRGDELLGIIIDPQKQVQVNRQALDGMIPPPGTKFYDALTPDRRRPIVLGYTCDLFAFSNLSAYLNGFEEPTIVLCYDYQLNTIQSIVETPTEVRVMNGGDTV